MGKYRVALYGRKSRLKEDDSMEVERQVELLIEYAKQHDMEFDENTDIFKEEGSSEDWNRKEFQKMLRALESGLYDGVLCTEQDRISRDSVDMGLFKRFCIKESLLLFTLSKTYNFLNDEDNFMSGIQGEMDNHFMRITKRKLMRGRIKALKEGIFFGVPPIGYVKPNTKPKKLIIEPEGARIVKMIFDLYVNKRLNQSEIVDRLNLMGFKTGYNKSFTVRSTSHILSNIVYTGTLYYKLKNLEPIINENAHPQIIDEETFAKAQVMLAKNRIVPQDSRRGVYMLSKLIRCSKCNTTLSFTHSFKSSTHRENGKELYIMNCYSSMGAKAKMKVKNNPELRCDNYGSPANYVEDLVFKELSNYVDELTERIEILKNNENDIYNELNAQVSLVNERLDKLGKERKRVQEGYREGIYETEEAREILKDIKEKQLKLELEKKDLEGRDSSTEIMKLNDRKEQVINILSNEHEDTKLLNTKLREVIESVEYFKGGRGNHKQLKRPHVSIVFKM